VNDPGDEQSAELACQYSRPFEELKAVTITIAKDGSLRVPLTTARRASLALHPVEPR
jgi:hypothetical protein